ncbi:MAG: hypothetical protein M3P49_17845 [Actinomycetota bacterium]|nr:hypothetical protein [Actinomycetota bacterium]
MILALDEQRGCEVILKYEFADAIAWYRLIEVKEYFEDRGFSFSLLRRFEEGECVAVSGDV